MAAAIGAEVKASGELSAADEAKLQALLVRLEKVFGVFDQADPASFGSRSLTADEETKVLSLLPRLAAVADRIDRVVG